MLYIHKGKAHKSRNNYVYESNCSTKNVVTAFVAFAEVTNKNVKAEDSIIFDSTFQGHVLW